MFMHFFVEKEDGLNHTNYEFYKETIDELNYLYNWWKELENKKEIDNKIRLSGFIIPWNYALYTPGNIIHSDGNLVGNWMVCYSKTKIYSTALLRDKNNNQNNY